MRRAWALAALLAVAAPGAADAQVFLASRPHPPFTIGPLFVRASVAPGLGPVTVDVMWSLVVPPTRSAADLEQDLYLLWPGGVTGPPGTAPPGPALAKYVEARGFDVIGEGRLPLFAQNLYQIDTDAPLEPVPGGAPYVTFVRSSGPLGLTAPATYIRIPWTPKLVNRAWLVNLRLTIENAIKPKTASWFENLFWGHRHVLSIGFHDVRHRAVFPMYFEHRDRVVRLADDPSQLLINFADVERLKIDEVFPPSSGRRLSESLDSTEVVSLFLDRSEGVTPQVLTVQFAYFTGAQSWAPVLIPTLFFVLGNVAAVLIRGTAERLSRRWAGRVELGPPRRGGPRARQTGMLLPGETLARIEPGKTPYAEVLRLCGAEVEEQQKLATPDRRTLVYRGQKIVPVHRRVVPWVATVSHWQVEHHEVEIELDRDVVRDVQARVRRSRLERPEPVS